MKVIRRSSIDVCAIVGAKFASSDAVAGMLLEAGCMRRQDEATVTTTQKQSGGSPMAHGVEGFDRRRRGF